MPTQHFVSNAIGCVLGYALLVPSGLGQEAAVQTPATPTVIELRSDSARPLRDLAWQLEEQLSWRIPYEEAPIEADELLTDEAPPAVKASKPGARFLVPRSKPLRVTIEVDSKPQQPEHEFQQRQATMERVFAAFQRSGNQGFFRLHFNGDFAFILPAAFVEKSGAIREFQPLLDTPVTVPAGNRTVGETVRLIIREVSTRRGWPITEGLTPTNLFRQQTISFSADEEPPRDALIRLFGDVGTRYVTAGFPPPRVTWSLLYEANERQFYFNATVLRKLPEKRPEPFLRGAPAEK